MLANLAAVFHYYNPDSPILASSATSRTLRN